MATKEQVQKLTDLTERTYTKIEEYKRETEGLKYEIYQLREVIRSQTKVIEEILKNQQSILSTNDILMKLKHDNRHGRRFPIKSQDELDSLERDLNESNKCLYVEFIKNILPYDNMQRNLTRVITADLIMEYNIDGLQGKKRLLDYPNLLDCLYKATSEGFPDFHKFMEELRKVIRLIKNRLFKNAHVKRLKEGMPPPSPSPVGKKKIKTEIKMEECEAEHIVVNNEAEDIDDFEQIYF